MCWTNNTAILNWFFCLLVFTWVLFPLVVDSAPSSFISSKREKLEIKLFDIESTRRGRKKKCGTLGREKTLKKGELNSR